jgi:CelD/BcsL family acetyltransferase involved in cellulose biosynthesis
VLQEDVVPGLSLPATWDDYLALLSKRDRHELRRKLRRLAQAGEYRLVRSTPETLKVDVDQFLEMMQESRDEKRHFLVPDREAFFRSVVARMDQEGSLRLFFLELAGQRVAAVVCFDYGGRRLLYNSGYRLSYNHYSVGLMLKALCLQQAIEEGLTYFDFLRGPEPYKYDLGAQDVALFRILVRR